MLRVEVFVKTVLNELVTSKVAEDVHSNVQHSAAHCPLFLVVCGAGTGRCAGNGAVLFRQGVRWDSRAVCEPSRARMAP